MTRYRLVSEGEERRRQDRRPRRWPWLLAALLVLLLVLALLGPCAPVPVAGARVPLPRPLVLVLEYLSGGGGGGTRPEPSGNSPAGEPAPPASGGDQSAAAPPASPPPAPPAQPPAPPPPKPAAPEPVRAEIRLDVPAVAWFSWDLQEYPAPEGFVFDNLCRVREAPDLKDGVVARHCHWWCLEDPARDGSLAFGLPPDAPDKVRSLVLRLFGGGENTMSVDVTAGDVRAVRLKNAPTVDPVWQFPEDVAASRVRVKITFQAGIFKPEERWSAQGLRGLEVRVNAIWRREVVAEFPRPVSKARLLSEEAPCLGAKLLGLDEVRVTRTEKSDFAVWTPVASPPAARVTLQVAAWFEQHNSRPGEYRAVVEAR